MATSLLIREDSTESIYLYPQVDGLPLGQPTSATVRVRSPAVALPDSTDSATVDTLSATVASAGAAEGDTSIPVTGSTAWIEGRRYLASKATGEMFVVESARTVTGTTLYLKDPLPASLASADTVVGWMVSHALTADETAERGPGLAIWQVLIGGRTVEFKSDFYVARGVAGPTLTSASLERYAPIVLTYKPASDEDLTESIDASYQDILEPALKGNAIAPERIVSWRDLEPAHRAACVYWLARDFESDAQKREELQKRWNEAFALALRSRDFWYDAEDTLAAADTSQSFATVRRTR